MPNGRIDQSVIARLNLRFSEISTHLILAEPSHISGVITSTKGIADHLTWHNPHQ